MLKFCTAEKIPLIRQTERLVFVAAKHQFIHVVRMSLGTCTEQFTAKQRHQLLSKLWAVILTLLLKQEIIYHLCILLYFMHLHVIARDA